MQISEPINQPTVLSWKITDHACRFCLGRVLQRSHKGGSEVRCAQCGGRADGGSISLCCCGADCGQVGVVLECYKNPNVTNEVPHEIMVRERLLPENVSCDLAIVTDQPKPPSWPPHFSDGPTPTVTGKSKK